MRLRDFVREHRAEIDAIIRARGSLQEKLTDKDRSEWVLNDEPLYRWAQSCGVPV